MHTKKSYIFLKNTLKRGATHVTGETSEGVFCCRRLFFLLLYLIISLVHKKYYMQYENIICTVFNIEIKWMEMSTDWKWQGPYAGPESRAHVKSHHTGDRKPAVCVEGVFSSFSWHSEQRISRDKVSRRLPFLNGWESSQRPHPRAYVHTHVHSCGIVNLVQCGANCLIASRTTNHNFVTKYSSPAAILLHHHKPKRQSSADPSPTRRSGMEAQLRPCLDRWAWHIRRGRILSAFVLSSFFPSYSSPPH